MAEHLPCLGAVLITRLKFNDILVCSGLELLIGIKSLLGTLIESLQVRDLRRVVKEVGEAQVKLPNEHAELGAPITHMIDSEHLAALKLKNAADAVTLNC